MPSQKVKKTLHKSRPLFALAVSRVPIHLELHDDRGERGHDERNAPEWAESIEYAAYDDTSDTVPGDDGCRCTVGASNATDHSLLSEEGKWP